MANFFDVLSLLLTLGVVGGVIYAVVTVTKAITSHVETTKENLKNKGYTISDKGVSIKTNKRFDREDYVDATQRGFVKAMGATSFGQSKLKHDSPTSSTSAYSPSGSPASSSLSSPPIVKRSSTAGTTSSTGSLGDEKKKKIRNPFKRTGSQAS